LPKVSPKLKAKFWQNCGIQNFPKTATLLIAKLVVSDIINYKKGRLLFRKTFGGGGVYKLKPVMPVRVNRIDLIKKNYKTS